MKHTADIVDFVDCRISRTNALPSLPSQSGKTTAMSKIQHSFPRPLQFRYDIFGSLYVYVGAKLGLNYFVK